MCSSTRAWVLASLVFAHGCTDSGETDVQVETDAAAAIVPYFPPDAPWYVDVSASDVDPDSAAIIAGLQAHGWGSGDFHLDYSIEVLEGQSWTPRRSFEPTSDFYEPDCDNVPMPVPVYGNLEGEVAYECTGGLDCHLIVAERDEGKLYEMWHANIVGDTFTGGCLAVWDMETVYPDDGRGVQCTSADAGGLPIAPLLFTSDEVASGVIEHALRFALPNDDIDNDVFYAPATHATDKGADGTVPYGALFRLKADFDLSRVADPDARVIITALQTYGMYLADDGVVPLLGKSDRRSDVKWRELFGQEDTRPLLGIEPQDFEVVKFDTEPVQLTFQCVRNGL